MQRRDKAKNGGGELHVMVIEARGLKKPIFSSIKHPFCVVRTARRQEQRTETYVEDEATTPFWNALFVFDLDASSALEFDILASGGCMPAKLGHASMEIDLDAWQDRELRDVWLPLQIKPTKSQGEIHVRIEFKLSSNLFKHPSVITLPVTQQIQPQQVPQHPPPAPQPKQAPGRPSEEVKQNPSKLPTIDEKKPQKSPSSASPLSLKGDQVPPVSLKAFDHLYLAPALFEVQTPHFGDDGLQPATYKESSRVYLQHGMTPSDLATVFQRASAFPKDNHLLKLLGFAFSHGNWCAVLDFAPRISVPHSPAGWPSPKLQIALDVARAMVQLHSVKQIHGHIRLANVFQGPEKARLHPFPRPALPESLDALSLPWAAPETSTATAFTLKMDVFAFGMFLIELDTGVVPFQHERQGISRSDFYGLLDEACIQGAVSSACPHKIVSVIVKCLALSPSNRPSSLTVLDLLREI
ncbi:hypothetical protein LEN26_003924 [Aphanomyces euteiches]|nr:hypothetical protein LEN26_003924 [Aphanomyces euteiches]